MKYDMIKDLSISTGIKFATLQPVIMKQVKLMAHDVFQTIQDGEDITEIDIGIGTIQIKIGEENCFYRFIPCAKLQQAVEHTVKTNEDVLVTALEEAVAARFEKTYREMF